MMRSFLILFVLSLCLLTACGTAEDLANTPLNPAGETAAIQPPPVATSSSIPGDLDSTDTPVPPNTPVPTETPLPTDTPDPLITTAAANEALITAGLPGSAERIESDDEGIALAYDADGNVVARIVSSNLAEGDTRAVWMPQGLVDFFGNEAAA
jgi:hypothetical protein